MNKDNQYKVIKTFNVKYHKKKQKRKKYESRRLENETRLRARIKLRRRHNINRRIRKDSTRESKYLRERVAKNKNINKHE